MAGQLVSGYMQATDPSRGQRPGIHLQGAGPVGLPERCTNPGFLAAGQARNAFIESFKVSFRAAQCFLVPEPGIRPRCEAWRMEYKRPRSSIGHNPDWLVGLSQTCLA